MTASIDVKIGLHANTVPDFYHDPDDVKMAFALDPMLIVLRWSSSEPIGSLLMFPIGSFNKDTALSSSAGVMGTSPPQEHVVGILEELLMSWP